MQKEKAQKIYEEVKQTRAYKQFDEEKHCIMMLECLGRLSEFCVKAKVSDRLIYYWLAKSEIFQECYALAKMFGREAWEQEGLAIRDETSMPGVCNTRFEHWKLVGWSRYGIGKNTRIRLELKDTDTPDKHYSQLIKQAGNGDFTASEIKQLMEAINVGLTTQQVINLQREIDQLRTDLAIMKENTNGNNPITDKRIT